jgi:hypothetical protein
VLYNLFGWKDVRPNNVGYAWEFRYTDPAATKEQTTIEELLEAIFSVRSVPRLYKESALSMQSILRVQPGSYQAPASKDVSPEAEERPPLQAVTEQRDWEHYCVRDSDSWSVVTSRKSVQ